MCAWHRSMDLKIIKPESLDQNRDLKLDSISCNLCYTELNIVIFYVKLIPMFNKTQCK